MNKANLKSYAPIARLDFISAVTARAHLLGINSDGHAQVEVSGDIAIIDGREWPTIVAEQREKLIERIALHGFEQSMEEVAYTWFNRFAALRFMELHDYLEHGWRVLSSQDGGLPEILRHAHEIGFAGFDVRKARDMQMAGNQDNELFKMIIVAQCNELSRSMPFLFERIEDETELLLPENLLMTDSIVAKLVESVPEDDWAQIEAIGWLYQYYISEKKAQVIGKVVKSEDIPAATQLFTPNWIVKYLVQNSVGRMWLMTNPMSTLRAELDYYVDPAQQSPEVEAELATLMAGRIAADGATLDPKSIRVLDPACGSGHILVEAYELLKAIYVERGFRIRDIPRLILENNLYGLDIDERAIQLSGFALLMKARQDDRRILVEPPMLNLHEVKESDGLSLDDLTNSLASHGIDRQLVSQLLSAFTLAKTYGSLIKIPTSLRSALPSIIASLEGASASGDLYATMAARDLLPLARLGAALSNEYDAVVANPPYMGSKGMNPALKDFAKKAYPDCKADLFAMFIDRGFSWCRDTGFNSMVTMQNWMFLSSYEQMRERILAQRSLMSLIQLPYDGKGPTAMGINFGVSASVFQNTKVPSIKGSFDCFRYFELTEDGVPKKFPSENERNVVVKPDEFMKLPSSPVAYWVSDSIRNAFGESKPLLDTLQTRLGMSTAGNHRFLRCWHEVSLANIGFQIGSLAGALRSGKRWFPYQKGGAFRKWYGNGEYVVNWFDDGREIKENLDGVGRVRSHNYNGEYSFREGVTWSDVTSGANAFRYLPRGFLFDGRGSSGFARTREDLMTSLGLLNSRVSFECIAAINPTIAVNVGEIGRIPVHPSLAAVSPRVIKLVEEAVSIAKLDWDSTEQSWDFTVPDLVAAKAATLHEAWASASHARVVRISRMHGLETELNEILVAAYGVGDSVPSAVPEEHITLLRPNLTKDGGRLVSYAIGCMMGRYSLARPGIIAAHGGGMPFDPDHYGHFPADADGIVPMMFDRWFDDDAAHRIKEFLAVVWGGDKVDENLSWLAESLGVKGDESSDATLRRYVAERFYKEHLSAYKNRPIYWMFSSGRLGAFQALVYVHRYNEGTLARMRSEYVTPLIAKYAGRLEMLGKDLDASSSAGARSKLQKQIDAFRKMQGELLSFEEKLRHYADMRIPLNLDDGIRFNYAQFGDLLAESKLVVGADDE